MAINKFVTAILNEKPITLYGDGTQTRDFTFVSDIVDANLKAASSGISGSVFNIGGGSRITVNELVHIIEKKCGKKGAMVYQDTQKGDVMDTLADITKAKEILGWAPQISIQEGIHSFIDWYNHYHSYKSENFL